ncbi:MAG: O-acetyl-ADP-ribose deacetylase [Porticoccus sp.]|nr:O-acetyl-ADP-ribose deacetylase [Porticoccus sp.]
MNIEILQADITKLKVDAIVNAANNTLCGGGGVDGAIHRAAGEELLAECRTLKGCSTGRAKITKGYYLPATYVIHTVGPVWSGGHENEEELLASCYRESIKIANEHNVKTLAFPAISCGAYRFPIERACEIAMNEVIASIKGTSVEHVIFACSRTDIAKTLEDCLEKHA